jgi:predicted component of type VI protein secretion system
VAVPENSSFRGVLVCVALNRVVLTDAVAWEVECTVASLTIIQRPNAGQAAMMQPNDLFILCKDETLIGRRPPDRGNDLELPEPYINRQHAKITRVDGAYWVEDLQSRNGTFLNRNRLTQRALLQDGDVIQICSYALRFSS